MKADVEEALKAEAVLKGRLEAIERTLNALIASSKSK